jgi:hypothetical protein
MSFTMKAVLGVTAAAAVCLSAAGCTSQSSSAGGTAKQPAKQADPLAGLTGKQIATKAISDLKSEPSFTIAGTGPYDGQTATMSIGFGTKGCVMAVDLGSKGSFTFITIGSSIWMRADAQFWKSEGGSDGADEETLFAGKYVKIPASAASGLAGSAGACSRNNWTSSSATVPLSTDVTKGAATTVNGQRAYPLTGKSEDTTVYVTDTPAPQIIEVVDAKSGDRGKFTVTYGIPKSITAPPASETATMP